MQAIVVTRSAIAALAFQQASAADRLLGAAVPSMQTAVPGLATMSAAASMVSTTVREGKGPRACTATPSVVPPTCDVPRVCTATPSTFSPACSAFTCDTATAARGELTRGALLISPTAEASCHPNPTAAVAPFNARAFLAARGQPTSRVIPDPSLTLVKTVVQFCTDAVVASGRSTLLLSCWNKGYRVDCCIEGMLESPVAPLLTGVSSSSMAPVAANSPSLVASLPPTGTPRVVVDAGGALLPSTGRSRAVVNVFVASLPLAIHPRAVGDAPLSLSPSARAFNLSTASLSLVYTGDAEPPSTQSSSLVSASPGGLFLSSPSSSSSLSSAIEGWMSCRGIWGSNGCPMRAQNQAAIPLNHWLFSSAIVRLCASSVLLQRLQLSVLQLRQGQPALAQGQLCAVQEEETEQKQ
jgi:hypothetical protein